MARATTELVTALRTTAARLREGSPFAWGHMGSCICGHLAQTVTELSPAEIHRRAMERHGDWSEQSIEHCPASGLAIDHVIDEMLGLGLTVGDLRALERLEDRRVLARVPAKWLRWQEREHAVQYMEAWAELLEEELEGVSCAAAAATPTSERAPVEVTTQSGTLRPIDPAAPSAAGPSIVGERIASSLGMGARHQDRASPPRV